MYVIIASQRASIDKYVQQAKEGGAEEVQACATIPNMVKGSFIHQPVHCMQEEVMLDHYIT